MFMWFDTDSSNYEIDNKTNNRQRNDVFFKNKDLYFSWRHFGLHGIGLYKFDNFACRSRSK